MDLSNNSKVNELVKKLKAIKVQGATDIAGKALGGKDSKSNGGDNGILFDDPEPWSVPAFFLAW